MDLSTHQDTADNLEDNLNRCDDSSSSGSTSEATSEDSFGENVDALLRINNCLIALSLETITSVRETNLVQKFKDATKKLESYMQKLARPNTNFCNTCEDCS